MPSRQPQGRRTSWPSSAMRATASKAWNGLRARAASRHEQQLDTSIEFEAGATAAPMKLLDLDLALDALSRERSSLAELIEMRYFGGMTAEETAEVAGRSVHVIRHELRLAHAWLRRELTEPD